MLFRSLLLVITVYGGSLIGGEFLQPAVSPKVVTVKKTVTETVIETQPALRVRCHGCKRVLVGIKRGDLNPRVCVQTPIYCYECERVVVGAPRIVRRPYFNIGFSNSFAVPRSHPRFSFRFQIG